MSRKPCEPKTALGKALQSWRLAEKRSPGVGHPKKWLTQADAANYFGMSRRTYQELEQGRSRGTRFTRTKLMEIVKPKGEIKCSA